jgi:environmental stress-induced protein Ves
VIGGPSRDFNVMTRRAAFTHHLMLRPVVDTMVLFPERALAWFVYVSTGALELRHEDRSTTLNSGESAWIGFAPAGQGRCVLRGGGELALVKLEAAA